MSQPKLLLSIPYIGKPSTTKPPLAPLPFPSAEPPPPKSRYVNLYQSLSEQKTKRMECNRKSAAASRLRRARYVKQLEEENAELRREIEDLRHQIVEAKKVDQVKETEGN